MGLHGSPTCVMRFDEATGWLVGEPGRGLNAMFVMMNAARLHVALQGIGLLDAAWQKADAYAQERRQMRAPGAARADAAGPDRRAPGDAPHPRHAARLDRRRPRARLPHRASNWTSRKHHPDAARRDAAQRWCSLVTPVLKAAFTDQAFHGASDCLQVFGGHGYVREWGIEQIVRDARVAMIYEGTNEIQAIDLLVRKVLPDGGAALLPLLDELRADLRRRRRSGRREGPARRLRSCLRERCCAATAGRARRLPYWLADDFLRAVALLLMAWAWARMAPRPARDAAGNARPASGAGSGPSSTCALA